MHASRVGTFQVVPERELSFIALVWVQPLYQYLVIPNTLRGTNRGDGTNRADSESPFLVSELWP